MAKKRLTKAQRERLKVLKAKIAECDAKSDMYFEYYQRLLMLQTNAYKGEFYEMVLSKQFTLVGCYDGILVFRGNEPWKFAKVEPKSSRPEGFDVIPFISIYDMYKIPAFMATVWGRMWLMETEDFETYVGAMFEKEHLEA